MKKVTLFLLLGALSSGALANGYFNIRAGADLYTKVDSVGIYSSNSTEDFGYEFGVEYLRPITEKLDLGFGIAYQKHADISGKGTEYSQWNGVIKSEYFKGYEDFSGYDSVPLYITGRYILTKNYPFTPYIKASVGYSFNINGDNIRYIDKVENENEQTDVDLGGQVFQSYSLAKSVKDGLYYSVGLGVEYKSFTLETLYQVNTGKINVQNQEYNVSYDRVSLVLGYKF
ncbi:Uncharacterised protein [Fusobacterium necrogenes]|uniref:Uncharacterized protein n=1 Tax=Fusobacterium necrogenes TaxID=858 RepID=A0A377GXK8_9FUSO|nr:outer membrane beta-barrel protein [Fusobacterium necrogenes]STO31656.1 Uncharacterised protein [Fusobacterium necrogenes]